MALAAEAGIRTTFETYPLEEANDALPRSRPTRCAARRCSRSPERTLREELDRPAGARGSRPAGFGDTGACHGVVVAAGRDRARRHAGRDVMRVRRGIRGRGRGAGGWARADDRVLDGRRPQPPERRRQVLEQEEAAGSIFTCQSTFNGGGAFATGPWVHANGTWDKTAKPKVDGSVTWPHSFTMSVSGSTRVFTGNDLPTHPTGTYPIGPTDDAYQYDRNPNSIAAQALTIRVPVNPVLGKKQCVRGEVGIMLTGAMLFDGLDAGGRDAAEHEIQDACGGHPQNTGLYHYHDLSACVSDPYTGGQSALLGYALDGFGIYGKYDEHGRALTNADLDSCHGRKSKIMWNGKLVKTYHYVMTSEYPYSVGCFRGTQVAVLPR